MENPDLQEEKTLLLAGNAQSSADSTENENQINNQEIEQKEEEHGYENPVKNSKNKETEGKPQIKQRISLNLIFIAFILVLSSLQFGYGLSVTNTPKEAIGCFGQEPEGEFFLSCIPMADWMWFILVSLYPFGGLVGVFPAGFLYNGLGLFLLVLNNFITLLSIICCTLFSSVWMFGLGRFLIGVSSGIASSAVSLLLNEIAPLKIRGTLGVAPQLFVTVGILISNFFGMFLSFRGVGGWGWRVLLAVFPLIVFAFQTIFLVLYVPRPPRWLVSKGKLSDARKSLAFIRGGPAADIDAELEQITQEIHGNNEEGDEEDKLVKKEKPSFFKILFSLDMIFPAMVAITLGMVQQLCGVNAVFYYSATFLKSAGLNETGTSIGVVAIGFVNVLATIFSFLTMDFLGRKTFLLFGQFFQTVFFGVLTLCFVLLQYFFKGESIVRTILGLLSVVATAGYVVAFAVALGPIPWMIISEVIVHDEVKGLMSSVACSLNWLCNVLVGLTFGVMSQALGPFVFMPFVVVLIFGFFFSLFIVKETKGKSREQVKKMMSFSGYFFCLKPMGKSKKAHQQID